MDERSFSLDLLNNHKSFDTEEEKSRVEIIQFIKDNKKCFENDFKLGHITGSALVIDKKIEYTLLTHHLHLNKWFQFGGHSDGYWNPLEVAWREAHEESGLNTLEYLPAYKGVFDVDVHPIPAKEEMPDHKHYDIRILLVADIDEPYIITHESHDLKWVKIDDIEEYNSQPAFLRMIKKVKLLKES